ncbi:MAG: preprotein translocase subunit SecE [Thermodesulfobacteriota bacterium]
MEQVDKAKQFVAEARQELRKVTWPTKKQITSSTWIVLLMVSIMSIFFGLTDYFFGKLVKYILQLG